MTILVTAASGQLGRLVVDALLTRGAEPSSIVAGARDTSKLADVAARGVQTVELDYSKPETLAPALEGVDAVLLISGSEVGRRVAQHRNVIEAAKAAGVAKLVYTSAPKAATADYPLAPEHAATEAVIAESGVPAVILRNNWYIENYAADVARAAESGVVASSSGTGVIVGATRADLADAAAVVLLEDGHLGEVYELSGDRAFTYADLASAASEILGREVAYTPLTTAEHVAALEGAGLPADIAGFVAGIDAGIASGVLDVPAGGISRLTGRPTTTLVDGLRAALADSEPAAA